MLNFIVLGQVPGTQFQITFNWVLLMVALTMIVVELFYHHSLRLADQVLATPATEQTSLKLRFPKSYSWSLVIGHRQYTLSVEL